VSITAIKRFEWVWCVIAASRIALINEITDGKPRSVSTFNDYCHSFLKWWVARISAEPDLLNGLAKRRAVGLNDVDSVKAELINLYNWEWELWGVDHAEYLKTQRHRAESYFESFKVVNLFYLAERALTTLGYALGIGPLEYLSHSKLRHAVYQWLFEPRRETSPLRAVFPYPFNVAALTTGIRVGADRHDHQKRYSSDSFGLGLGVRIGGATHTCCTSIWETALKRAVRWYRDEKLRPSQRKRERGKFKAFFLDVLWHYSESFRYRLPLPHERGICSWQECNRNVRWLGSALLTLVDCILYTVFREDIFDFWLQLKINQCQRSSCVKSQWRDGGQSSTLAVIRSSDSTGLMSRAGRHN
jgi:hypothetical protein